MTHLHVEIQSQEDSPLQPHAADPLAENLLVRAALEALLAKSANRLDAAARGERLKAATLMECAEKGYSNLTIADIARRAKVSTATIYADYKDRDALLVASMEMLFAIVAGDVIEIPQVDDPVLRVEQLLMAHGYVYAEPLSTWFFRLHVHLAWSGYPHLHGLGRQVFEGIDAFWIQFLGELVAEGWLVPLDYSVAIPLLLGPIERCTIISRLACGDDETGRPALADVARQGARTLFDVWGGPTLRAQAGPGPTSPPLPPLAHVPAHMVPLPQAPSPSALLEDAIATMPELPTPDQRKHRILLAAAIECQERGYNAASMIEAAARARVSTATLYKHFDDKPGLFASALEDAINRQGGFDGFEGTGLAPRDRLAGAVFAVSARCCDPDWVWMHNITMASEISGTERVVAIARNSRTATEAFLATELARLPALGHLQDDDLALAINFLLGGVERTGLLTLILFGGSAIDLGRLSTLSLAAADVLLRRER